MRVAVFSRVVELVSAIIGMAVDVVGMSVLVFVNVGFASLVVGIGEDVFDGFAKTAVS